MSKKFEPQFAIASLQNVAAGMPVIYQQGFAFTGVNPNAPQRPITLAVHDAQQRKFIYRYFDGAQPNVLVPTTEDDSIIKPDLYKLSEDVNIHPASHQLFMGDDDQPYIVVELPGANQSRLLGLYDGAFVTPRVTQMRAFSSWEIGVMSLGEFVLLLKI